MDRNEKKIEVVMFSGGRGTASIADALSRHPEISLTLLINAYDDGLSTGRLRTFIPGMLGPSDIRKNFSRFLTDPHPATQSLKWLLEYRFPDPCTEEDAGRLINDRHGEIDRHFQNIPLGTAEKLGSYLQEFLGYYQQRKSEGISFGFGDCSLGNLFFAGLFLQTDKNFNRTVAELCQLAPINGKICNVTRGENLFLAALKADGSFLCSEAEIVSKQTKVPITELYLLPRYLTSYEEEQLLGLPLEKKRQYLFSLSVTPEISPEARSAIANAHVIVYGPGTQHSSLFPSYLTNEVGETIVANRNAEKIFIANIQADHEIQRETVSTLTHKLVHFMNRGQDGKFLAEDLVTRCFFHEKDDSNSANEYIRYFAPDFPLPSDRAVGSNMEAGSGVHIGGRVVDELIAVVNAKAEKHLQQKPYMVSIVVAALNEEKAVGKVLRDLSLLNFANISKEIIFVDGGSSDSTYRIAQQSDVRAFQLADCRGRGHAFRFGVERARGNLILFFPADGEYAASDIYRLVNALAQSEFDAVFGSRVIKCVNYSDRIREIYEGNTFIYLISKYGGMLISFLNLFFYNRFISDPLTGMKGFRSRLLHRLQLKSDGLNLETEILAKLGKQAVYILEIPVDYYPRKKSEGKKSTVWDGMKAIAALVYYGLTGAQERESITEKNPQNPRPA